MTFDDMVEEIMINLPSALQRDRQILVPRWIRQGMRETSRRHWWSFLNVKRTIPITSGVATVELPGEPINVSGLLYIETSSDRTEIEFTDLDTAHRIYAISTTGKPGHAVLITPDNQHGSKWQLQLFPTPDAAYTATIQGQFYLPDIKPPLDENRWTTDHPYLIMEWAMWRARRGRQEYQKAQLHLTEYDKMLEQAIVLDNARSLQPNFNMAPAYDAEWPGQTSVIPDRWGRGV